MELNIVERMILIQILPREGDFVTLKIVRDLQGVVGFSEEEYKEFELREVENGTYAWNSKGNLPKEIPIGEKATDIIVDALKKLNNEKKLTEHMVSLYEKFIK